MAIHDVYLQCHYNLIAMSLQSHCNVTTISLQCHYNLIAMSLQSHCHVTTISLPCRYNLTAMSLQSHCNVTTISLPCHYNLIAMSLQSHCHVTTTSLQFHYNHQVSAITMSPMPLQWAYDDFQPRSSIQKHWNRQRLLQIIQFEIRQLKVCKLKGAIYNDPRSITYRNCMCPKFTSFC